MKQLTGSVLLSVALVFAVSACKKGGEGSGSTGFTHKNEPDNLKKYWEEIVAAAKAGNGERVTALVKGLIPNETSVKKALVDGVDDKVVKSLLAYYEQLSSRMKPEDASKGFKSERSKVTVHGATTEQIAKGDPAASEFPGGAKTAAGTVLRPATTFYEVELTEPDKDVGTKFHLFYWDGSQWRMLGAVWRATR